MTGNASGGAPTGASTGASGGASTGGARLRDLGHRIGWLEPGPHNAITDVAGVLVGHTTLVDDDKGVYTGVTAVVPAALDHARTLPAGLHVANGYGKLVGATQLMELGELETPILLTATLSTFRAADVLVTRHLDRAPGRVTTVNPVVGEVNDYWLSDAEPRPITAEHVHRALDGAHGGPVAMGNAGGGTGACALGFKGGIGSSSRRVELRDREVTVGALVQANMDGNLRLPDRVVTPESLGVERAGPPTAYGSCVVVVALDLACESRQLARIAARGAIALGRAGAAFSHGSGDYGLAFSTVPDQAPRKLDMVDLDRVFVAVMEAVEEAVLDGLLAATTISTPRGRRATAVPHEAVAV
ncbi:P1 family peptidase [Spirillospora sp. NPDC047279]|uniref:P1 family peptidase n=1 Tax=Spirillospora sp. NPDC047279 TaxID=3155478 RepID=UPI0034048DBC